MSGNAVGTICQDAQNLSVSHPLGATAEQFQLARLLAAG